MIVAGAGFLVGFAIAKRHSAYHRERERQRFSRLNIERM